MRICLYLSQNRFKWKRKLLNERVAKLVSMSVVVPLFKGKNLKYHNV